MFQDSEVVNLVLGLVGISVVALLFLRRALPRMGFFYAGFFVIFVSLVATVVEGYMLRTLFNRIEHVSLAVAGILFAVGCLRWFRQSAPQDGDER